MTVPYRKLHATRATDYFQGRQRRANVTPAILWLLLLLGLIVTLRTGRVPSISQALTLSLFAIVIVAAGVFLPELVVLFLVGLLLAGTIGVPAVAAWLEVVRGKVDELIQTNQ